MNTWTDIKAAFEDIIGDHRNVFFSDDWQVRAANRALEEMCRASRYKDQIVRSNIAADTNYYTSSSSYDVTRVEFDDEVLTQTTKEFIRRRDWNWEAQTGLPRWVFLDQIPNTGAADSIYIGVYPAYGSDLVNGLRVWSHGKPTAVSDSSPSDELDIPDWAVGGVLFYMLRQAFMSEVHSKQDFGAAAMYEMLYEDVLDRLVHRANARAPKRWVSGGSSRRSRHISRRLPDGIPSS